MKHNPHINFFRAILIALVILIHIVHFGILYPEVKSAILAFIMPTFLLITGYLANINKTLKSFSLYLLRILLPYVIMVVGYALLSLYLPVHDGLETFSLSALAHILFVTSIGPYWFLHTMLVCGILYYLSFHLPLRFNPIASLSIFATLLILTSLFTPLLNLKSGAYYFIGVFIKLYVKDFSKVYIPSLWLLLPFLLLISNPIFQDWGSLSILFSTLCFLSVSAKVYSYIQGQERDIKLIDYVGKNTFPIYIFHPIFTMLAKYYQPIFIFDPTGILHALTTILVAIAGSLCIAQTMDRIHLSYIFGRKKILR